MLQNRMVEDNIRLVYWVLQRFAGRGYDMEELFQVGTIGLVKAARRFDPDMGTAFSTYAVPMIAGEIRRFLRDDGMMHISRKIKSDAIKIATVREQWKKTENREPTLEELSNLLVLTREEILLAIGSSRCVGSIYEPSGAAANSRSVGERTMEACLEDPHNEQESVVNRLAVRQLVEGLDERSRTLIGLRYRDGMTQRETAQRMGMTQVSVSRLEKKILLHLRGKL